MLPFHQPETDLPISDLTARARERKRLERAISEFEARGGKVQVVDTTTRSASAPAFVISARREEALQADQREATGDSAEDSAAEQLSDEALVALLRARALVGHTLRTASRRLRQPLERCHTLARTHRLPFKVGYVKGGSRS